FRRLCADPTARGPGAERPFPLCVPASGRAEWKRKSWAVLPRASLEDSLCPGLLSDHPSGISECAERGRVNRASKLLKVAVFQFLRDEVVGFLLRDSTVGEGFGL